MYSVTSHHCTKPLEGSKERQEVLQLSFRNKMQGSVITHICGVIVFVAIAINVLNLSLSLKHTKSDFLSCMTSLPCSSRLVLFISPLSSPSVFPGLACMCPRLCTDLTRPLFGNKECSGVCFQEKDIGCNATEEKCQRRCVKLRKADLINESCMEFKGSCNKY